MSDAPDSFDPLEAPFDQYQRYRITADIARRLAQTAAPGGGDAGAGRAHGARPWLLDVGGHHTDPWGRPRRPIRDFLPEVPSITLDVTDNPLAGFIRGRGDALPFTSASFPLVCSVDVLEHVPPAARPLVLGELTRVSSRAIVLAAPFRHRDLDRAEALIAAFVLRTNGYVQGQLQEHREFGWPDLTETMARIASEGWHVRVFPFGNLWRWALMMIDKHAAIAQPGGRAVQAHLDRRYNETLFAGDRSLPCYRHFIFATRDAGDPLIAWSEEAYGAVADAAAIAPQTSAADADRLFDLLQLHAQNQTLQAQTEPLRRDTHLAELEARYAEQQRCLEAESRENARLVQLLRDVEQSPAYRVGSLLRRFGRTGR